MSVYDDTIQGLKETLEYVKGDKSKGRSHYVELTDEEVKKKQLLWLKIDNLSDLKRKKVEIYIDELIEA